LADKGPESITIIIKNTSAHSVGVLIALFERGLGLYALLIYINAYHQPGVEARKLAAANIIRIQHQILEFLSNHKHQPFTPTENASQIHLSDEIEFALKIYERRSSNPERKIKKIRAELPLAARCSST
jgi:glucose-6-phosphate isomerase